MNGSRHPLFASLLAIGLLLLGGCQGIYYDALESIGIEKREVLVDRVEQAQTSQEETKEQFQSALDAFLAVVDTDSTRDMEAAYRKIEGEFKRSEAKAKEVGNRINAVEDVARALFREWEAELDQYTSENLRQLSERTLNQSRDQYQRLIAAMRQAESKIDPVLNAFRDQTLFLKHNLNAMAIASLKTELGAIEEDVAVLVGEMQTAIDEASAFINVLTGANTGGGVGSA